MDRTPSYKGQLTNYIKKNLRKGYTIESLRWALINQNHSRIEIDRALKRAEEELAKEAPILKTKPKITYELIEPALENPQAKKEPFWKRFFG